MKAVSWAMNVVTLWLKLNEHDSESNTGLPRTTAFDLLK